MSLLSVARTGAFLGLAALASMAAAAQSGSDPWTGDLTPIGAPDWNRVRAAHLLERAGFGGTPEEVDALARLSPEAAVARLLDRKHRRHGPDTR